MQKVSFAFALEYVSDTTSAKRFFTDVLGLTVERDSPTFVQFLAPNGTRYAIASDQHAFFRIAGSSSAGELFASDGIEAQWAERWTVSAGDADYSELAPREPIAEDELRELDRLAQEFSREWIWFEESPLEETAVERARFADYGYPVRAANLRSEKLRKVLRPERDRKSVV